jgi:hypothetical protein
MTISTEPPVLDAFRYTNAQYQSWLVVWCAPCARWHWHGTCGPIPGRGDGHRVAHCFVTDSPYHCTGYVLREVGTITDDAMQAQERCHRKRRHARRIWDVPTPWPQGDAASLCPSKPRKRTRKRRNQTQKIPQVFRRQQAPDWQGRSQARASLPPAVHVKARSSILGA